MLDIIELVCYPKAMAGACAQAFRYGGRYPPVKHTSRGCGTCYGFYALSDPHGASHITFII